MAQPWRRRIELSRQANELRIPFTDSAVAREAAFKTHGRPLGRLHFDRAGQIVEIRISEADRNLPPAILLSGAAAEVTGWAAPRDDAVCIEFLSGPCAVPRQDLQEALSLNGVQIISVLFGPSQLVEGLVIWQAQRRVPTLLGLPPMPELPSGYLYLANHDVAMVKLAPGDTDVLTAYTPRMTFDDEEYGEVLLDSDMRILGVQVIRASERLPAEFLIPDAVLGLRAIHDRQRDILVVEFVPGAAGGSGVTLYRDEVIIRAGDHDIRMELLEGSGSQLVGILIQDSETTLAAGVLS